VYECAQLQNNDGVIYLLENMHIISRRTQEPFPFAFNTLLGCVTLIF